MVGGTAVALPLGAFLDASLGLAAAMGSTAAIVSVIGAPPELVLTFE